jgi:hypothetical protein
MPVNEIALANKSEVEDKLDESDRPQAGSHINEDTDDNFNVVSTPDHSEKHESGGSDEMSVDGLSGELTDPQPPKSHSIDDHNSATLSELNNTVSDAELDDSSDARPAKSHGIAGSEHEQATLSDINQLVSDATLDDSGDPRPPEDHNHDGDSLSPSSVSISGTMEIPAVPTRADIGDSDTGMIFIEDEQRVVQRFQTA